MTSPTPYQVGPFDSEHLYLQWGGKLPGNEEWSCGIRLAGAGGGAVAAANGGIGNAATAIESFHTRSSTGICYAAKLSFIKLNAIGTDGRYTLQTTQEVNRPDVNGGSQTQTIYPNQVALAVSLTTGFSRGPAHRGRFYLPMPTHPVDGDGTIPQSLAVAVGGSVDVLLADLATGIVGWTPSVFSRKAGAAGHRAITGCEVGRVLDTQRRRRRSLIENYA